MEGEEIDYDTHNPDPTPPLQLDTYSSLLSSLDRTLYFQHWKLWGSSGRLTSSGKTE